MYTVYDHDKKCASVCVLLYKLVYVYYCCILLCSVCAHFDHLYCVVCLCVCVHFCTCVIIIIISCVTTIDHLSLM